MTLRGIKKRVALFLVNILFCGTKPYFWNIKRNLLNWAGYSIGENTKIVGPLRIFCNLKIGDNCWVGTDFTVHGNGTVIIGNSCDIAPDVIFLTGSHKIGDSRRRAGEGLNYEIKKGDGVWIGARSTILGNIEIGSGCIIGACSLVNKSFSDNKMIAGIPAQVIKELPSDVRS